MFRAYDTKKRKKKTTLSSPFLNSDVISESAANIFIEVKIQAAVQCMKLNFEDIIFFFLS